MKKVVCVVVFVSFICVLLISCDSKKNDIVLEESAGANETISSPVDESDLTENVSLSDTEIEVQVEPEPVAEKSPQYDVGSVVIVTENLRLRSEMNTSSLIVTTLKAGSYVRVIETGAEQTIDGITDNWIMVQTTNYSRDLNGEAFAAGQIGWCFGGYVKKYTDVYCVNRSDVQSVDSLPVEDTDVQIFTSENGTLLLKNEMLDIFWRKDGNMEERGFSRLYLKKDGKNYLIAVDEYMTSSESYPLESAGYITCLGNDLLVSLRNKYWILRKTRTGYALEDFSVFTDFEFAGSPVATAESSEAGNPACLYQEGFVIWLVTDNQAMPVASTRTINAKVSLNLYDTLYGYYISGSFGSVYVRKSAAGYSVETPAYRTMFNDEETHTYEELVKSYTGDYYLIVWQEDYNGSCLWKKVVYFGPAGQVTLDAVRAGANGTTLYEKADESSAVVGKLAPESFALIKEKGERFSRSDFVVDGVTYKYTWICRWVYVEDLATDQSGWMYDLTFDGK